MTKDGADTLPTLNDNLLQSFPKASGGSFADSWIRMEIYDYYKTIEDSDIDLIFLTADLLNALMSSAENINTIYIYNRNEIRPRNRNPINNLIYTISNYFEEINLIIKTTVSDKEENFMIKGVWGGKTVEEWSNKMVIFNKISV